MVKRGSFWEDPGGTPKRGVSPTERVANLLDQPAVAKRQVPAGSRLLLAGTRRMPVHYNKLPGLARAHRLRIGEEHPLKKREKFLYTFGSGVRGFLVCDDYGNLFLQHRDLMHNYIPEDLHVYTKISVDQGVTKSGNGFPVG